MKTVLPILVIVLASVNLLMSRFALVRLRQPTTLAMWMAKVCISALSPVLFLVGIVATFPGTVLDSLPVIVVGSCGALLYLVHIIRIAIRHLHSQLTAAGIPVVMQLIPQTDHAFDLILPRVSPSAHNAFYEIERYSAFMV